MAGEVRLNEESLEVEVYDGIKWHPYRPPEESGEEGVRVRGK